MFAAVVVVVVGICGGGMVGGEKVRSVMSQDSGLTVVYCTTLPTIYADLIDRWL